MTQDFATDFVKASEMHGQPYVIAFPVAEKGWRILYWLDDKEHGQHRLTEKDALEMLEVAMLDD